MTDDIPFTRDDILEMAKISAAIADNPCRAERSRRDAEKVYQEASFELLYCNDATQRFRLVPLSFRERGHYSMALAALVAKLPEEVLARQRVSVLIAEKCAKICDCQEFSADCRLDALSAFTDAVDHLRDDDDETY